MSGACRDLLNRLDITTQRFSTRKTTQNRLLQPWWHAVTPIIEMYPAHNIPPLPNPPIRFRNVATRISATPLKVSQKKPFLAGPCGRGTRTLNLSHSHSITTIVSVVQGVSHCTVFCESRYTDRQLTLALRVAAITLE